MKVDFLGVREGMVSAGSNLFS